MLERRQTVTGDIAVRRTRESLGCGIASANLLPRPTWSFIDGRSICASESLRVV